MKARQHSPSGEQCLISLWPCCKQGGRVSTRRACQEVAFLLRRQNGEVKWHCQGQITKATVSEMAICDWWYLWKQTGFVAKHSLGITCCRGLMPILACLILMVHPTISATKVGSKFSFQCWQSLQGEEVLLMGKGVAVLYILPEFLFLFNFCFSP